MILFKYLPSNNIISNIYKTLEVFLKLQTQEIHSFYDFKPGKFNNVIQILGTFILYSPLNEEYVQSAFLFLQICSKPINSDTKDIHILLQNLDEGDLKSVVQFLIDSLTSNKKFSRQSSQILSYINSINFPIVSPHIDSILKKGFSKRFELSATFIQAVASSDPVNFI
jgi:hypothetical protein